MTKFFIVFIVSILLSTFVSASVITEKIENIIGTKDYKIHNSLINSLFKNEKLYIVNGKIK
ncbi:MAG: hypothetical protein ACI81I_000317, partial [Arcobacteraceae bacterium]